MRVINYVSSKKEADIREVLPSHIESLLPLSVVSAVNKAAVYGNLEELRLRSGRHSSVICGGKNIMLDVVLCMSELEGILKCMCNGSLYAYSDTINNGYLILDGGVRVGIGGRASGDGEAVSGVHDVCVLCIRIPHATRRVGREMCDLLDTLPKGKGILIYSPPGVGKTTLLRGIARYASMGDTARRVVVIDTRGELSFSLDSERMSIDVLSGYPKRIGIEIATRTLNPELIICDEIGDPKEAHALISSHNCGIPLIASAHAGSIDQLMSRTGIRLLHSAGIFGCYVGISRDGMGGFDHSVTYHKEVS